MTEGRTIAPMQSGLPEGWRTVRRNAIVTSATCTTEWPMARQHRRTNRTRTFQSPRRTSQGIIPVWKENGGSGDLMVADHEDVQETEASDIHVNRFKSQEVLAKEHYAVPCANGTSRRPSIAESKLDREDDKKKKHNRRFVVYVWIIQLSTS